MVAVGISLSDDEDADKKPKIPLWYRHRMMVKESAELMAMFGDEAESNPMLAWLLQFCILTSEQQEKFTRVFEYCDTDGDGALTVVQVCLRVCLQTNRSLNLSSCYFDRLRKRLSFATSI